MSNKNVKIQKDGIVKIVAEKDMADYLACGWKEVKNNNANPFANNDYMKK